METENTIKQYNEQRGSYCGTLGEIVKEVVEEILNVIDDDLYKLAEDVLGGNYSNVEIADRLQDIRQKI